MALRHEVSRIARDKFGLLPDENYQPLDPEQLKSDRYAEVAKAREQRIKLLGELAGKGVLYITPNQSHDLEGTLDSTQSETEQKHHN